MNTRTQIDRFLRLPEVTHVAGKSRSSIYAAIADGTFPRPIHAGKRLSVWLASEVAAINAAHTRGANEDEIRALVSMLEAARTKAA